MAFCRKCGGDLDPDGTCAMCMLAGGLDPQPDDIAGTTTVGITAAFETLEISLADLESDSFGPYSILRVLGEGGMGAVYLAEQTRPRIVRSH